MCVPVRAMRRQELQHEASTSGVSPLTAFYTVRERRMRSDESLLALRNQVELHASQLEAGVIGQGSDRVSIQQSVAPRLLGLRPRLN